MAASYSGRHRAASMSPRSAGQTSAARLRISKFSSADSACRDGDSRSGSARTEDRHCHSGVPRRRPRRALGACPAAYPQSNLINHDLPQSSLFLILPKPLLMHRRIDTEADVAAGLDVLITADPRLAKVAAVADPWPLRRRPGGFAGMPPSWSRNNFPRPSAGAIWGRLAAAYDPSSRNA